MMSGKSCTYPFTASQWHELEDQTLIYRYMSSGMPIPSELILHMRSRTTMPFAPQPSMGWGLYQVGYGCRKAEDPEPGRCRRTDGKKWRCSKDAYPDYKYCEKHMHRGKNRSRKPVEMSLATNTIHSSSSSYPNPASSSQPAPNPEAHGLLHPYLRYFHGPKGMDEYPFRLEASRADQRSSLEFRSLEMSSLGDPKHNFTTQPDFTTDRVSKEREVKQQNSFVLGADINLEMPVMEEREEVADNQHPLRHFFDERPQKKDSWMDLDENRSASYSKTTQLSISVPVSYYDFPVTGSRYHHDD